MATGKPLEIIVDETLYDLKEVNDLVEQGHTVKKLVSHGYDLILGPKASNLTVADIKANPKLLEIALLKGKELKYPKQAQPKLTKKAKDAIVKEAVDGMEDTPTHDGTAEETLPAAPIKRKRGPRKAKPVVEGSPISEGSGPAVDPSTISDGDSTSDGGE